MCKQTVVSLAMNYQLDFYQYLINNTVFSIIIFCIILIKYTRRSKIIGLDQECYN